ncbi:Uncharacterised protein [Chlamydia trachomatis]|nr:Uncharacterised protein [Chlamydia trachomatis]
MLFASGLSVFGLITWLFGSVAALLVVVPVFCVPAVGVEAGEAGEGVALLSLPVTSVPVTAPCALSCEPCAVPCAVGFSALCPCAPCPP